MEAPTQEQVDEAVREWSQRWTMDWKRTIEGVAAKTGMTRREVIAFQTLVHTYVGRQVIEQLLMAILGRLEPDEEAEATKQRTFG